MSAPLKLELFETSLKPLDKKLIYVNKNLPSPPFRWILSGSSGAGKTTLIKNILMNKAFGYGKYFSEIYCWLGSLDDVEEMKLLVKAYRLDDKIVISNKFNNDDVKELIDDIEKSSLKEKDKPRVLFILDDMITQDISKRTSMNVLDECFIRGRHIGCGISLIIASQKYTALNQNMRMLNATAITVFSSTSAGDLEKIAEEWAGIYDKEQVMEVFKKYLQGRYDYITIDSKKDNTERFRDKGFLKIEI